MYRYKKQRVEIQNNRFTVKCRRNASRNLTKTRDVTKFQYFFQPSIGNRQMLCPLKRCYPFSGLTPHPEKCTYFPLGLV